MPKKILSFMKKEIVFTIACLLALLSCFFVTPSGDYINYIDFRTLALLLALMLVVQGLNSCSLFHVLVTFLIKKAKSRRQLAGILILLCFFSSMLITNDVALITFVPFTILLLNTINLEEGFYGIYLIVLETIAANLGSMFTPIGNPQNLYLYSLSNIKITDFMLLMLPYTGASLLLLLLSVLLIRTKSAENLSSVNSQNNFHPQKMQVRKLIIYLVLFVLCIMTVIHILDYRIMLGIVLLTILLVDRKLVPRADYILLLTFVAFFIFVGNIKNIPEISTFLSGQVSGHECITAILASQCISNVPAAMLLSGFTADYGQLIVGTNLGGLGTLIASMASLISYKFYAKTGNSDTKRYFLAFSGISVLFLIILFPITLLL